MAKLSIFLWLFLSSLLANAQEINQSRLLASGYQPQSLEQANAILTAVNKVDMSTSVEYKAGQAVILQPGFEARAGSVFTAHTGMVAEGDITSLRVNAYPNPFEEVTTISYVLVKPGRTSLHIRDAEGRLVIQLVDGQYQQAGSYKVDWKGGHLPAGTYLYTLETGPQQLSKRIVRK